MRLMLAWILRSNGGNDGALSVEYLTDNKASHGSLEIRESKMRTFITALHLHISQGEP